MDYKPKEVWDAFAGQYVEYKSEKDKISSTKRYFDKTRLQSCNMIDDLRKSGLWKIHLTIKPKFKSSTCSDENRLCILKLMALPNC